MSFSRVILQSSAKLLSAIARRPRVWPFIALIPLALWFAGVPVIRLSYGAVVIPIRSTQYFFSSDKKDAQYIAKASGLSKNRDSFSGFFDEVGLWAVLHTLRNENLSLKQQAIALSIVQQESSFRFYAKNRESTACGLYQLIAASGEAHNLSWWRCMDPLANTDAGTAFFRQINAKDAPDFESAMRCSYLRHYYGPAHKCSADPHGIWKKVGTRMTYNGQSYLKALQQIESARAKRNFIERLWDNVSSYFWLGLVCVLACFILRYLSFLKFTIFTPEPRRAKRSQK